MLVEQSGLHRVWLILDGVGPVDKRPSTYQLYHVVQQEKLEGTAHYEGLLLAPAEGFGLRFFQAKKEHLTLFWLTLGHFWHSVVTSVTFSSNLSNFEKKTKKSKKKTPPKKNPKFLKKINLKKKNNPKKVLKKSIKTPTIPKINKNCQKILKSQKSIYFFFFFQKSKTSDFFFQPQKKTSLFLNIKNTRFDPGSPVQPNLKKKNLENSLKI